MCAPSFFDSIAEQWDSWEREDMLDRLERVAAIAQIPAGSAILDVGTGTGVFLPILARLTGPSGSVLAIDDSAGMLAVAARKPIPVWCRLQLVRFEDLTAEPCTFDRIMMNAVFPHLSDGPAALRRAHELLRPGGRLCISHPIGREAVNLIHQEAGGAVGEDQVPATPVLIVMLESAGFARVEVIDEPEFHLALGHRSEN